MEFSREELARAVRSARIDIPGELRVSLLSSSALYGWFTAARFKDPQWACLFECADGLGEQPHHLFVPLGRGGAGRCAWVPPSRVVHGEYVEGVERGGVLRLRVLALDVLLFVFDSRRHGDTRTPRQFVLAWFEGVMPQTQCSARTPC